MTPTGVRGGGSIEVIAWLIVFVFIIAPVIGILLFVGAMVVSIPLAVLFALLAVLKDFFTEKP
jgi:hypothetical protein